MPSIKTHNGRFTVTRVATGEHRTFRIKTNKAEAEFAPNERIVSLLSGPDNTNDYQEFGILKDDGHIVLWHKYRNGGQIEKLAKMLENLDQHEAAGHVIVQSETVCRCCNRPLTNPESIRTGLGPVCSGRSAA